MLALKAGVPPTQPQATQESHDPATERALATLD
jgi:hypothetical protein